MARSYAYKRLPRHRSGYAKYWIEDAGKEQRTTLKARQDASAMSTYPSAEELRSCIGRHAPGRVLDVGCGYGRHMEMLEGYFETDGCDIADDLLEHVRADLRQRTFHLDIVKPPDGWVREHRNRWDVSYAWCVFMFFIDDPESARAAMHNLDVMTEKKVLVWDWKHVCDYMKSQYPSDKFEYHHIPVATSG